MKIPDKAYGAFLDESKVYYLKRRSEAEQGHYSDLKLPAWLQEAIQDSISQAFRDGQSKARSDIREVLGL